MLGMPSRLLVSALGSAAVLSASATATPATTTRPVEAYVEQRSYAPGQVARLIVRPLRRKLVVDVLQIGPGWRHTERPDLLSGIQVSAPITVGPGRRRVRVPIGDWASGMYAVRIRGAGRLGYAPFVLRPRRLGEHRVAVVMP